MTTRESHVSKHCQRNELGSDTEITGEKTSLENMTDTKCSLGNIHIADRMDRSSTTSTKSFIESEEDAASLEKLVLSACFSEKVKKAFVALSTDFVNPRQNTNNTNVCPKSTDDVEKKSNSVENAEEFSEPPEDVGSAHTGKEPPLKEKLSTFTECFRETDEADLNQEGENLINPQKNARRFSVPDINTTTKAQDDSRNCHELINQIPENENKQSNVFEGEEVRSTEGNHLDSVTNVVEDVQAIKATNQETVFTGENKGTEFDCDDANFDNNTERTKLGKKLEKADAVSKNSTDFTELENNLERSSTKNESEATSADKSVQEEGQPLREKSKFHESCSTESDNTNNNSTYFSESEYNPVRSSSSQAISDKQQSYKEELTSTDHYAVKEKTHSSIKSRHTNLIRPPTKDRPIPNDACCPDNKVVVGFSQNSASFKDVVESMLSSSILNQSDIDSAEDICDVGAALNEGSVSKECFSMENIDFDKNGKDNVHLETTMANEDMTLFEHVPDTPFIPLSNNSGFTGCYLEREETRCDERNTNAIDFGESLPIPSSSEETDFNVNENICDESKPWEEFQYFTPGNDGTAVVNHAYRTNDKDKFVTDQQDDTSESVNECLFDMNSPFTEYYPGNEITEETNEDLYEILNSDQESVFVKRSTLYEIENSSTRDEPELNEGKNVLDNERKLDKGSTVPANSSTNKDIEMREENEVCDRFIQMYKSSNIQQENECPFEIFKESILYDTGYFNTDTKSDDSLPERSVGSTLYEIVSLPTGNVEEFCVDGDCHNNGLSLNEDSTFPGCCSEEHRRAGPCSNSERKMCNETESTDKSLFRKIEECECSSDLCEDSMLTETFSYCKIDREASCEGFEEVDKDCCCQCCECIRNDD